MYAPLPSALVPTRVLFLSRSESSVRMDVRTLRGLGVNSFTHLAEAPLALAWLEKERERLDAARTGEEKKPPQNCVDLLICDESLGDVPAAQFLYQLSLSSALRAQPVLALTASSASSAALRAAGVYVLQRPYTPADLKRMMQKAMSPLRRRLHGPAFEKASARTSLAIRPKEPTAARQAAPPPMTTSDWYKKGMEHLKKGAMRPAGYAFAQVLERKEDHVGACLGLARVYRAEEDVGNMRRYLLRAAAASLREGDKVRAAAIRAMLPASMRDNIFALEAADHMEEGSYRMASLSFLDACRERPDIPLHRQVARACFMMARPEECMKELCAAFDRMGHKATAVALRRRLLDYQPFSLEADSSWLDKYPRLKEAVSVAAYTAWAWKHA